MYYETIGQLDKRAAAYNDMLEEESRMVARMSNRTEGTTPTEKALTSTVVQATPTQYGMFVILSDLLLKTSPITDILSKAVVKLQQI